MLFTFPSRYLFAIGLSRVFSLARWCWPIQTEFHLLRPTQDTDPTGLLTCTGLSPPTVQLSRSVPLYIPVFVSVLQPRRSRNFNGLGFSQFARRYYGNRCCFLFLRVLRCFSSPGSPTGSLRYIPPSTGWVVPFGNLRITPYLPVPAAYRSLSRPSSPSRA